MSVSPNKNSIKKALPSQSKVIVHGKVATLTKSKKSSPGDGTYGNGVKGDRGGEA